MNRTFRASLNQGLWVLINQVLKWLYLMGQPLVRTDPRVAVFAGRGKTVFAGNPKHLFEYCIRDGYLDSYWLTKNRSLYRAMRTRFGKHALYAISLRAVYILWKCRFVFIAGGAKVATPYPITTKRKIIINLWHGAAVKKIGYERDEKPSDQDSERDKLIEWETTLDFTHIIVSSPRESDIVTRRFRLEPDRIWVTGLPRNDQLLKGRGGRRPDLLPPGKKIVLYAPTWRDTWGTAPPLPLPDLEIGQLEEVLSDHDAALLIRPHPKEVEQLEQEASAIVAKSKNILFPSPEDLPDTNTLLPHVDVLVTDYSSIFVDFLLLDRPIIFVPHDYEEYTKNRGLAWDYWAEAPGPTTTAPDDFLRQLRSSFEDPSRFSMERMGATKAFHGFTEGSASARIVRKIKDNYMK